MEHVAYRLGIDLGSTSLGWAVLGLDESGNPDYLMRLGVRIFGNGRHPKTGASLAVDRRLARQQRRRRDRQLRRKRRLLAALREAGLFPVENGPSEQLKSLNPYELRHRGLSERLEPFEIGRAVLHLNQRRGFRSSRRTDRGEDAEKEKGKIASAVAELKRKLQAAGAESLGSFLYARLQAGLGTRARLAGEGAKAYYEFYPDRHMLEAEFNLLWERQTAYHPGLLTPEVRDRIRGILLFQRPLRPVRPGRCSLNPNVDRAPLALPSVQRFRIWQEINNLRWRRPGEVIERSLDDEQRKAVFQLLETAGKRTFAAIRRAARLPSDAEFNLQGPRRDGLLGNSVAADLSRDTRLGPRWNALSAEEQDALVSQLVDDTLSDEVLLDRLKADYSLDDAAAEAVLAVRLPDGYSRLGLSTINALLPHLEAGMTYDKAVLAAGFEGTNTQGDGSLPELPYYGKVLERHVAFGKGTGTDEERYGRIANPSVHIALNQLRLLMNALIKRYGKPTQVVLELTRDIKLGYRRAREIEAKQAERQRENDALRDELGKLGIVPTAENLLRLRLHRELCGTDGLASACIYTGEQISISRLFSAEVEIDHILPHSRTLDDSIANKVLCLARANRYKGNRSPWEAFAHSPDGYSWEAILERASRLRRNRYRRFTEDAMQRFEAEGGFLARQLTDTAYMSRLAREYVSFVCPDVWVTTGQLTGMLRRTWGLNSLLSHDDLKNRRDHRHHAVDAVVIACIDRSTVKRVADASARASEAHAGRLLEGLPEPWPTFRRGIENGLARVVVSYRPEHSVAGPLHNDTAYGLTDDVEGLEPRRAAKAAVHHFVPLVSLAARSPSDIRVSIPNRWLADSLASLVESHAGDRKAQVSALEQFGVSHSIRRVRWRENLTVIPIARRGGGPVYKAVVGDGNYCYEIYGTASGAVDGRIVSRFTANGPEFQQFVRSPDYRTKAFTGEPLIARLIVGDMVRLPVDGQERIYRVQKITQGKITLAYSLGSGDQTRDPLHIPGIRSVITVAPSRFVALHARRVFVDILGRVFDPGSKDASPNAGSRG
jgi:CRISPR-associated endonuclease Csn1